MLTEEHKSKRMGAALTFLERYYHEGDTFLDQIVTGDTTWVSHIIPESKRQSLEWHHSYSPAKPPKIPTDVVNPNSTSQSFFRPERRPSGEIHAQRPNHQRYVILCNSEAPTTRHPTPPARPAVNRSGYAAR
jgi:hypothetical protein